MTDSHPFGRFAEVCAREALRRGGTFTRDDRAWRFGRRLFNNTTIRHLVDRGEAVIEGNTVRGVVNDKILSLR